MIKDILKNGKAGDKVTVNAWLRSRRDSKAGISFLALSDGSCQGTLQAVAPNTLANYDSEILKLTKDCAVTVSGELVASPGAEQSVELAATSVVVVGWIDDPETYPVSPKRHTMEHLRDYAHLRPRTNVMSALTRIRHGAAMAIIWILVILIIGACAGAAYFYFTTPR